MPTQFSDTSRVRLMTIHQSKGLEFPTVLRGGAHRGVFPSHRFHPRATAGRRRKGGAATICSGRDRAANLCFNLSESEGYLNGNGALKYPSELHSGNPDELLNCGRESRFLLSLKARANMVALLEQRTRRRGPTHRCPVRNGGGTTRVLGRAYRRFDLRPPKLSWSAAFGEQ